MTHLPLIERYLNLLESFASDEADFAAILHPEMEQIEFPNALNKNGQISDRAQIFARLQAGRKILAEQRFTITNHCEQGNRLYVESGWVGTMAADAGPLKKGQKLSAHFCMAFDLRDGKIYRQRNYDCFENFL